MVELHTTGRVSETGAMALYMDEIREAIRKHKGARVIATFRVLSGKPSEALRGYYYNYIIPTIRIAMRDKGERMTDAQVDEMLCELSPVMKISRYDGRLETQTLSMSDADSGMMLEHIEFVKQFAAEELSCIIDDPKL